MKTLRSFIRRLSNVLFIAVILAFITVTVVTVLSSINMRQDKLLFGSFGFGRVVTGSMEPVIPTGSFILVKKADTVSLQAGDIILFRSSDPSVPDNTPVSHEIIRVQTDQNGALYYTTKGAANPTEDTAPVYPGDILGVVTYSSVAIGWLIGLSQTTYIYPVLIVLLCLSMIQSIVDVIRQFIALSKEQNE